MLDKTYDPKEIEARLLPRVGAERRIPCASGIAEAAVLHRHPAAQRHRQPAHGPCPRQHAAGRADPLAAHEGRRRAVAARHRPCRHRHPDGRGAQPRAGGHRARRRGRSTGRRQQEAAQSRRVPGQGLGMEGPFRRHHHQPAAPARRLVRLEPRALHHGRGPVGRRPEGVRRPLQGRADLQGQPAGQLGPQDADRRSPTSRSSCAR